MNGHNRANALIGALHRAKADHGAITPEAVQEVARETALPPGEVMSVATFFSAFNGMDDGRADNGFLTSTADGKRPELFLGHPKGYLSVKKMLAEKLDVLEMIRAARLRGRSGSGFPIADKWALTMAAEAETKYIVCNGSEGEGDTYKDYFLMVNKPEMVIEGVILCALTTGIQRGYLYVRAEYEKAFSAVEGAIREAYSMGVLGGDILGSGKRFDLEAVLGGGAYVSGEETALIEMLEGRRSEPRLKPPFPGSNGLFGMPTVLNNVESFASVAALVLNGVEAFASAGTGETGGSKLFTVSGCVRRPGVYELPHSAVVADALEAAGGTVAGVKVKGFQIGGGATGSFGNASQLGTMMDYGPLRAARLGLGTGAVRFIGEKESVPNLALRSVAFLKGQSCGVCTACRYGLAELTKLLTALCEGRGTWDTLHRIQNLCGYVGGNARCALGQSAPTALETAWRAFPEEFESLCKEDTSREYFALSN